MTYNSQSHKRADQKLSDWGVLDAARKIGIDTTHNDLRWSIHDPLTGKTFHRQQRRTLDKQLRWLGDRDDIPTPSFSALPNTAEAVRRAGDSLHLAKGIKEYLVLLQTGYDNTLLLTREGISTKHAEYLAEICGDWQVGCVVYAPDRDDTGVLSATSIRNALRDVPVYFDVRQLPFEDGSKEDLFDLYERNPADFANAYDNLPELALPAPVERPSPRPTTYTYQGQQRFTEWVRTVVKPVLDSVAPIEKPYRGDGWRHSPDPTREDRNPSFRISYDYDKEKGIPIDASGAVDGGWHTIADWVGAPSYKAWKAQNYSADTSTASNNTLSTAPLLPPLEPIQESIQKQTGRTIAHVRVKRLDEIEIQFKSKLCVFVADMGQGKTTWIAQEAGDRDIVGISPRQLLSFNMADTYSRWGNPCEDYQTLLGLPGGVANLRSVSRLSICLPSVPKMCNPDTLMYPTLKNGVLHIDEAKQCLRMMTSGLLSGHLAMEVLDGLRELARQADRIYLTDAHMNEGTLALYEELFGIKAHVVINEQSYQRGPLYILPNRATALDTTLKLAEEAAGEKNTVAAFVSSKKTGYELQRLAEDKGLPAIFINQDTAMRDEKGRDVNAEVGRYLDVLEDETDETLYEYPLVIYTTQMGTGTSCMNPIHAVVAIVESPLIVPDDIHQALNRFRVRGKTYVLIPSDTDSNAPVKTAEEIIDEHLDRANNSDRRPHIHTNQETGERQHDDNMMFSLRVFAEMAAYEKRQCHQQRTAFLQMAHGYRDIIYVNHPVSDAVREQIKSVREQESKWKKETLLANFVTDEEFETHKTEVADRIAQGSLRAKLPREVILGNEHYQLAIFIDVQRLREVQYDLLSQKQGKSRVLNLVRLLYEDMDYMRQRDTFEANPKNRIPLQDRKYRVRQTTMTRKAVEAIWGVPVPQADMKINAADLAQICEEWVLTYGDDLTRFWERKLSDDPVKDVRWLLKRYGIRLRKRKYRKNESGTGSYYTLEGEWEIMQEMAAGAWSRIQRERRERPPDSEQDCVASLAGI